MIHSAQPLISFGTGQSWVVVSAPEVPSVKGNKPQHCFLFLSAPSLIYLMSSLRGGSGLTESIFNHPVCSADLRPDKVDIRGVAPMGEEELGGEL